ncbi:YceD family protein [Luminiphilus sp.]|nr:YceD family protein [Luminiphilus sp.]
MTLGALPQTVEVRTLAAREVALAGVVDPAKLTRLSTAIVAVNNPVADFYRDEEARYVLALQVSAEVLVTCQRCLSTLEQTVASETQLAVVWTDEQAGQLPPRYEPLVADAEIELWEVVEDELLLALPTFSYHSDADCGSKTGVQAPVRENEAESQASPEKDNPFSVLKALKGDINS